MNYFFWIINVFIAFILICLKIRISRKKLYELAEKIPGPPDYPLIGAMHLFFGKDNEEVFQVIDDILNEYKSPAKAWLGPTLVILVDNPEDLKIVLNSPHCMQKPYIYDFLGVSKGLMAASAKMWKMHRKYLNPCFNPKLLQSFLPIFNKKSKILADRLKVKLGKDEFDVYNFIGKCTLDMICNTAMGLECDFQNADGDLYLESAEKIADNVNRRIFNVALHPFPIYKFSKLYKEEAHAWKGLRTVTSRVINNYKKNGVTFSSFIKEDDDNNNNTEKMELRKPRLFVEQVFEMKKAIPEFDEQSLTDEIDTLIAGGNETSALSVSFCLLMMAMHPDIQERVVNEMRSIFSSVDQEVTIDLLSKLEYLHMVLSETLRLFPITPLIGREIQQTVQLHRFEVPPGAAIIIPIYKVHRNVAVWGKESHLFNPDNFLPEKIEARHPYSYIPFSNGPRNCIGMKYSLLAMKTMLCHVLRRYKLKTSMKYSEMRLKMCLDLKISNKHMVQIETRFFK